MERRLIVSSAIAMLDMHNCNGFTREMGQRRLTDE